MSTRQKVETVAIRFPKATWVRVRQRAVGRGETGMAWLGRCAEVCLGVAESGVARGGVRPEAVEPGGSVAEKTDGRGMKELRYEPDAE